MIYTGDFVYLIDKTWDERDMFLNDPEFNDAEGWSAYYDAIQIGAIA